MRTVIISILLLAAIGLEAQSDKYASAMKQNLVLFDSAKTSRPSPITLNGLGRQKKLNGFPTITLVLP